MSLHLEKVTELLPSPGEMRLFRLAMYGVSPAAWAELFEFDAPWIVATVFLRCVIAFLALSARHRNNGANVFFRCHIRSIHLG